MNRNCLNCIKTLGRTKDNNADKKDEEIMHCYNDTLPAVGGLCV